MSTPTLAPTLYNGPSFNPTPSRTPSVNPSPSPKKSSGLILGLSPMILLLIVGAIVILAMIYRSEK